jgi:signal transduction histidine kinase
LNTEGVEHQVAQIVRAARRTLGCDAVIVTRCLGGGGSRIVAMDGISNDDVERLWSQLAAVEQGIDEGPATVALEDEGGAEPGPVGGLRPVSSAQIAADGVVMGALHSLSHELGAIDEVFVEVFAAHCATALTPRSDDSQPPLLAERVERTTAFDHLALLVPDYPKLVRGVTEAMGSVFGNVLCGLMIWDEEAGVLQLVDGSFGADAEVANSYQVNPRDLHSNAARVLELRRSYMTNHAVGDPAVLQDYVHAFGIERLISVPLILDDRAIGVLHVANKATDFTVSDLDECEWLATRLALLVEMTGMLAHALRQQRLEGVLSRIASGIARGHPTDRLLSESLSGLREVTEASALALVPDDDAAIVIKASEGPRPGAIERLIEEARGLDDAQTRVVHPSRAGDPGWAVAHIPVRVRHDVLAKLSVLRERGRAFDRQELSAFARMANLIALALAGDEVARQRTALARLKERERIADDLHDDSAQLIFAAQIQLDAVLEGTEISAAGREKLVCARRNLVRADSSIRNVISELACRSDDTLPGRIRDLAETFEDEYGIPVVVEIAPASSASTATLSRGIVETLLRVAREGLMNAVKHAGPCQVRVILDDPSPRLLRLQVVDDGVGFRPGAGSSHGLSSLQQAVGRRGGEMRVGPSDSGGTAVLAAFPTDGPLVVPVEDESRLAAVGG